MLSILLAAAVTLANPVSAPIAEPELILRTEWGDSVLNIEEYVAGVCAAEVPYTFHPEALKAQAVAARTYARYCLENGARSHAGADLCADPSHCCGFTTEIPSEIKAAVQATAGETLSIDGEAILAMWHASSAGATETCGEILAPVPYLQSVKTPEKPEISRASFSMQEVTSLLSKSGFNYNRKETLHFEPTESGRCAYLTIGNVRLTGREVRAIFGLKSTDLIARWECGKLSFVTFGYGHGIGMSQRGADALASAGVDYRAILMHYFRSGELSIGDF